jgi:hypothetical protein
VIDIFGPAVMARRAGESQDFTAEDLECLKQWESQVRQYAPEMIDFCRGWADGATRAGVAMSYEDVLNIWTGHTPPAQKYLGKGVLPTRMPPMACSGVAAWGRATRDGSLATGSSGDHDCTHMVTIVAFPKTGNNYIISPFSVVGTVPIVGEVWMMGHPGMNNQGVAYVHHGGVPKLVEMPDEWGYGIRRGMSTFHNLRFANSAAEAREMELAYPVGDAGKDSAGTAGGFYADSGYGYVAESRGRVRIIRESGVLGETDFLYANNAACSPQVNQAGWIQPFLADWQWEAPGGWRPKHYQPPVLLSAKNKDSRQHVNSVMQLMYDNSYWRNRYFFKKIQGKLGEVDVDSMKSVYRVPGQIPGGTWKEKVAGYKQRGDWGEPVTGHAGNALVAVMKPERGDEGIYALCVGPALRGLTGHAPYPHSGPIYNETNCFWELKLAADPGGVMVHARARAEQYLVQAEAWMQASPLESPTRAYRQKLLEQARAHLQEGQKQAAGANQPERAIYATSRATREYCRAQVRAQQVVK